MFFFFLISILFFENVNSDTLNKNWIYETESVVLNLDLNSSIFIQKNQDSKIEEITVKSSFYPKESLDTVISSNSYYPFNPEIINDELVYVFNNPTFSSETIGLSSTILSETKIEKVKNKINFPLDLDLIPSEYLKYMSSSEKIDSDDYEIRKLAKELSNGKNDLYEIAFDFANWVTTNIEYSLDSSTAEVSEKASWVLENRKGVCDELTSLYIALLRSQGIPARYVSGIAYTNSDLFSEPWGFHGWAQVYFPDYGWIDFDPTYGQYGFVDLSHIPLKFSLDSGESSISYSMKSYNAKLETNPVLSSVLVSDLIEIDDKTIQIDFNIDVNIKLNSDSYSFGSYGLLTAEIENLGDYYVPFTLISGKTQYVEIIGDSEKKLLLRPYEKKTIYWQFHISDKNKELDRDGRYLFPMGLFTPRNKTYSIEFDVSYNNPSYSLEEIQTLSGIFDENIISDSSLNFDMVCSSDKSKYYSYENAKIICDVSGNKIQQNLKICAGKNQICKTFSYEDLKEKKIFIETEILSNYVDEDYIKLVLTDSNDDVLKTYVLMLKIVPVLSLEIYDFFSPENLSYGQDFDLSFKIISNSDEKLNMSLNIFGEMFNETWNFDILNIKPFSIKLNSYAFLNEINEITIILKYSDVNGKEYYYTRKENIIISNLTIFDKVTMFFNKLAFLISNLF